MAPRLLLINGMRPAATLYRARTARNADRRLQATFRRSRDSGADSGAAEAPPALPGALDHRRAVELAQARGAERGAPRAERPAAVTEEQQRAIGEARGECRIVQRRDDGAALGGEAAEQTE